MVDLFSQHFRFAYHSDTGILEYFVNEKRQERKEFGTLDIHIKAPRKYKSCQECWRQEFVAVISDIVSVNTGLSNYNMVHVQ